MEYINIDDMNKIPRGDTYHNIHNKEYFQQLKKDISINGIKEPLTIRYNLKENTLELGEGHHRLMIANLLGLKKIPVQIIVEWDKNISNTIPLRDFFDYNHPPKPLDVEVYKQRNYYPTFVKPQELGFNTLSENHIKKIIKEELEKYLIN